MLPSFSLLNLPDMSSPRIFFPPHKEPPVTRERCLALKFRVPGRRAKNANLEIYAAACDSLKQTAARAILAYLTSSTQQPVQYVVLRARGPCRYRFRAAPRKCVFAACSARGANERIHEPMLAGGRARGFRRMRELPRGTAIRAARWRSVVRAGGCGGGGII